ncbi:MAG: hypothetical protein U5R48_00520 [Gammaproteobacteria bacterium]|nr:hypothetical protein [Gammaproteobacteria bacterium]
MVLSTDDGLHEGVVDAVGSPDRVRRARTVAEAIEMLAERPAGVLVTDAGIDERAIEALIAELKAQVPELVTIVASERSDAHMMINLINHGQVFRFLIKPLSVGQCRIWLSSAASRHLELLQSPDVAARYRAAERDEGREVADGRAGIRCAQSQEPPRSMEGTRMSLLTRSAPMDGDDNLLGSFAFASLVVILGVVIAWVVVKRGGEELVATDLALDAMPAAVRDGQVTGVQTLLDQAELAFAAGRIVEPRYDNALYFYQAVLSEAPDDAAASAGVDRVAQWLSSEVTGALDAREWERALAAARQLVVLRPDDEQARTRLERIDRIRTLSTEARRLAERGESASAARRWQQLLALDPGNLDARDGLRRALDQVVSAAGAAVSEDRLDAAGRMLAQVREIAPDAPGVQGAGRASRECPGPCQWCRPGLGARGGAERTARGSAAGG